MLTLLCTVSSTTVFSIHVLTSFLHGYSATLAAKLFIKLELSPISLNCRTTLSTPVSYGKPARLYWENCNKTRANFLLKFWKVQRGFAPWPPPGALPLDPAGGSTSTQTHVRVSRYGARQGAANVQILATPVNTSAVHILVQAMLIF